jgi:hypothetical protein
MKQIWKYTVDNIIEMPKGAEVLTVQIQSAFNPCIWVKVDPKNELEKRQFVVIGTGQSFDDTDHKYVGTYQDAPFVWHLFEKVKNN